MRKAIKIPRPSPNAQKAKQKRPRAPDGAHRPGNAESELLALQFPEGLFGLDSLTNCGRGIEVRVPQLRNFLSRRVEFYTGQPVVPLRTAEETPSVWVEQALAALWLHERDNLRPISLNLDSIV
jgi:hypothetical protein